MRALPTTRPLEALVAVAETLNFHDAARKLVVSQSTLSVQVRDLERLLGVQLFDRDRRAGRRIGLAWRAHSERGDEHRALAAAWRAEIEAWLAPSRDAFAALTH